MFIQIKDNSKYLQTRYEVLKKQREAQIKAEIEDAKNTESSQNLPKESTKKRGK